MTARSHEDARTLLAAPSAAVSKPGVLLRLVQEQPRVWDLAGMLPD